MPIQKDKVVSSSVSGNYWVTKNIQVAPDYSFARCEANLYASEASFLSGGASLYQEDVIMASNPVSQAAIQELIETFLVGGSSGFADFSGGTVV